MWHEERPDWGEELYIDTPSIFTEGNIVEPIFMDPGADNWEIWRLHYTNPAPNYPPLPISFRRYEPLSKAKFPVAIQSAEAALTLVSNDVGDNARIDSQGRWSGKSDAVDQRLISELRNGTGRETLKEYPVPESDYPIINSGTPYRDDDHDGMADTWELNNGLNPSDSSDGNLDADLNGYTNVEEFLNGIARDSSLPVEFVSFTATGYDGRAVLKWIVESELENEGFMVLRADSKAANYKMLDSYLTNQKLSGEGNSSQRKIYIYIDENVQNGQTYWYKLVDIDIRGIQTEYGPISVNIPLIPLEYLLFTNYPNPFNSSKI
jgi:hypothetical protein